MGFLKPDLPMVDIPEWRKQSRTDRLRPFLTHIAERGMGYPDVLHVIYLVKICLYVLGGAAFALTTRGIDGWSNIGSWWSEPIVFQKVVLWSLLFEVLGLGCGFGPLTGKVKPPLDSPLYWLRVGTLRQAPWPNRIPLTSGDRRNLIDVALYASLLAAIMAALLADGVGTTPALHSDIGVISADAGDLARDSINGWRFRRRRCRFLTPDGLRDTPEDG